ncbi:ATP-binding protein [Streptomyces sp. NPDC059740]|uniref:ATP-binding protein n=1 Tax=Streptomyces sp. NPDC059740 TaxID=3346926 RepID=UPI00366226BE
MLTGPSGVGKSSLALGSGLPVVALDDFYKEGRDPTLPQLPNGGGPDWDSPLSWDAGAALAALDALCRTGRTAVPVYDFARNARTGTATIDRAGAPAVVAEGIFAADLLAACRAQGLLADALCLCGSPLTTFRRRLVRDLREGRKPPLYLVRRGLRLLRGERAVVARQTALGALACSGQEVVSRLAAAAGPAAVPGQRSR